MEINGKTKLLAVLEAYPSLEDQIVKIAPTFKSLKNPVLRRTVGSLATLDQVAQMGGMPVLRLVNTLRRNVGLAELPEESEERGPVEIPRAVEDPDWFAGEPQFTVNGTELLEQGEVPVGKVNELLEKLSPGGYILLLTNFEPAPILEAMRKQKRQVYTKLNDRDENEHLTFIK